MTQMQKRHFSKRIYDPGSVLRDLREILTHFDEFRAAVRSKRISRAFAEKIMLAVTVVNGCRCCSYGHAKSALKYGVSSDEVDLLLRGEVGHVASDEVPALLFAQHYAESGGNPDPAMLQKLVLTYGPEKTDDILAFIRMISLGNLSGNTFDALLSRLQGCPAEESSLVREVISLGLLAVGIPITAVGGLARGVRRRFDYTGQVGLDAGGGEPMKILIFGAGVLGSFYALGLAEGGHDVSILARGQRLADIREHGIVLEEMNTGRRTTIQVNVVEELASEDAYDLVLVLMRANRIPEVLPALAANKNTPSVAFIGNNAAGSGEMVAALGRERVLMGFGGTGGVRDGHVIRYVGGVEPGKAPLLIAELSGETTPRLERIAEAFGRAGIEVGFSLNVEAYLKTHVALVSPLVNAIYMAGGDNYRLARTRDGIVLCIRAIREGFRVLRALGIPILPGYFKLFEWIPEPILVALLRRILDTEYAELGMSGHANVARDEFKKLADDFRSLARSSTIPTPAMDQLYQYVDPTVPIASDGRAEMPMGWRGVWIGMGALAGLLFAWMLRRYRKR